MTDLTAWQTEVRHEMTEAFRLARQAAQSLNEVLGKATSRHGELSVTVDALGRVRDLHVGGRVSELSGDALAQLLLTTIRQAEADAQRLHTEAKRSPGSDPDASHIHGFIHDLVGTLDAPRPSARQKMTDEQMDAYYARLNEDPLGRHRESW